MAGFFDRIRNLGRGLLSTISEGAARSIASFAERYDRNASLVYEQRAHLPRGRLNKLARQHLTGERAFTSMMRGAGGIMYPASWSADRARQVQMFRRWVFVGCDRICSTIAGLPPRLAYVRPRRKKPRKPGEHVEKRSRRQRLREAKRRRAFWQARCKKSLHAIKPHEIVEEVGDDHPCARLLKKPNAWDHSPGQLWYELILFLLLTGNAYLWVVPDKAFGKPLELWVVPSQWVWGPRLGPAGGKEYEIRPYLGGTGTFFVPADEIVHFAFKNPLNKIDGAAPIQAGAAWIDVSESIDDSRYWTFKQGTQASGALELGPKYDPDDVDIDAIGAKFLSRYQGEHNAGVPMILPPDVRMVPLTIAPAEMAFEGGFEQVRDSILALLAVPKGIAGITDPGSDRALWGERAVFIEQAILPRLRYIGETFTAAVCHRWDDELTFFWEDPTPADPQQINADLNVDYQHSLRSINEGRSMRGLEPVDDPWADEVWVQPNYIPLSLFRRQQEQAQQQPQPAPGAPPPGGGNLLSQQSAEQPLFDQPSSEQQQSQGQRADAEDAALDVNDQAWQDPGAAVRKAHEYNAKAQAVGSRWRLEQDVVSQRWRAALPASSANGHSNNGPAMLTHPRITKASAPATPRLVAAGLAVIAGDTGRALLLQRSLDENGANGGKWEFPGGHINAGESPRAAALREWQEETGLRLPTAGHFGGVWNSSNGVYRGYVYRVPSEDALDLLDRREGANPDSDSFEALAWVDPADFDKHNLRSELLADLTPVRAALRAVPGTVVKAWESSKHPRGGNPKNAGEFSAGDGGGGTADHSTRREPPPPPLEATRRTEGLTRQQSADYHAPSANEPSSAAGRSPLHKSLETSPLRHAGQLVGGAGQTFLLRLDDGTEAVFKPRSGEPTDPRAGRAGVPRGTQYRREIATSRVADVLGFGDLVPTTTLRKQSGEVGSAQKYVAEAEEPLNSDEPFDGPHDAARAALFDYLIGHLDRHTGNWLVKDGKLALIDNGLSFPTAYHSNDFFNMKFWEYAHKAELPMPDLGSLANKGQALEKELRACGLEDSAIDLVRQRFNAVMSSDAEFVADLPSLLPPVEGDLGPTLGDMAMHYSRDARQERAKAAQQAAQQARERV